MKALIKIYVALHHHRFGADVLLFDGSLEPDKWLTEEDVIHSLGDALEPDQDEWIEIFGPYESGDMKII